MILRKEKVLDADINISGNDILFRLNDEIIKGKICDSSSYDGIVISNTKGRILIWNFIEGYLLIHQNSEDFFIYSDIAVLHGFIVLFTKEDGHKNIRILEKKTGDSLYHILNSHFFSINTKYAMFPIDDTAHIITWKDSILVSIFPSKPTAHNHCISVSTGRGKTKIMYIDDIAVDIDVPSTVQDADIYAIILKQKRQTWKIRQ